MAATFHWGNLLDTPYKYICHQVNLQGVMGSGVAKCIKEKYPATFNRYRGVCSHYNYKSLIGTVLLTQEDDGKTICNMFSQNEYGYDGALYTSYDAFRKCLQQIKTYCPKGSSIAFPWRIASVRGGADWNVIKVMIEEELEGYDIHYYCLNKWEA